MEAVGIKSVHTRLNLPQGRSFETFFWFFLFDLGPGCKIKIKERKALSLYCWEFRKTLLAGVWNSADVTNRGADTVVKLNLSNEERRIKKGGHY